MLSFTTGNPTISYKMRYLLQLPHWVTKPAQTHLNLSSRCTATVTPTVTSYKRQSQDHVFSCVELIQAIRSRASRLPTF